MERKIDRFSMYMEAKQLNDNQVTRDCGLSVGLLNQARKGKSDLGTKAIDKILNKYQDLSKVWLLTGEGTMLVENSASNGSHSSQAVGDGATATNSEGVKECLEIIRKQQESIDKLVDAIAALSHSGPRT